MLYFKIIVLLPPLLDGCTVHLKKATLLLTFFADSQIEIDTDDGRTNEGSDVDQDEDDLPDVEEVRYDVTVVVLIVKLIFSLSTGIHNTYRYIQVELWETEDLDEELVVPLCRQGNRMLKKRQPNKLK